MSHTIQRPALAGMFSRAAGPASVPSWNPTERTVQVVMSTGASVARRSWAEGPYIETLEISHEAIDLTRADGMSFLDSHAQYTIGNRLGTVVAGSVRIEGGHLVGIVRLSRNERAEDIARDLDDGHPFSVSVGYRIDAFEWTEADGETPARLVATRWTPFELSIVAIPADPGSQTRSQPLEQQESTMPQGTSTTAPAAATDAVTAERERQATIRQLGRVAGIDEAIVSRALDEGLSADAFRVAAFDVMATRQEAAGIFPHRYEERAGGQDRNEDTIRALTEVLSGRSARGGIEVARNHLEMYGIRTGTMSDRDVGSALFGASGSMWGASARAMHTSGDFGFLVANAAHIVLLERFAATPPVLKRFSRQRNANDFRPTSFFRPGEAPNLLKVGEHGEIKSGTFSEEKNAFSIDTYARIFGLTFQASVNDGLNAFGDFLAAFADSATTLEANLFAQLLDGFGPKLDDGYALFDERHGNLGDPSFLTIDAISEAVISMRTQRNVNGGGYAGSPPTALLVGPSLETRARQLVATIAATKAEDVNPHNLEVVVEDRFGRDFIGWYLLASPASRPAFLHGGLEGHTTPEVNQRDGWEVLGREFRVVHHFGAGVNDHRAIYFNEGAQPT